MIVFETLLVVLFGAVLLSLLARRLKVPYPALLVLGGFAAAFLPFAPQIEIEPELVLALFIAPILMDAGFDSSARDLKRNVVPLVFMTVGAVAVTVVAVAWTAKALRPDLPWAAAVALGAAVAPPDVAAATAVLRSMPVPHRVKVILEGESLFNDASSLIIYRLAVGAVAAGFVFGWSTVGALALATVGSVAFAVAAAWIVARLTHAISDAPTAILLQFIITFGVWLAAERLHLSAVVTVVVYALVVSRLAATRVPAAIRAPSYAVAETVVFALNATAFVLVGLQVGPLLREAREDGLAEVLIFAFAVLGAVVLARLVWVMGYNSVVRLKNAVAGANTPTGQSPPTAASGLVIAWAGMRGVVTLAAAYALPANFPERDLLLLAAFVVVLGTLVVQGLTLGPLIKALKMEPDDEVEREVRAAREATARAAIAELEPLKNKHAVRLREEYQERLDASEAADEGDGREELEGDALRAHVLDAKRRTLLGMLKSGEIGDDAYYQLEEELDRHELSLTPVAR